MTVFGCAMGAVYIATACLSVFFGLDQEAIMILTVMFGLDVITGTTKSRVLGKNVSSKGFIVGIISKCVVLLIPMVVALISKNLKVDMTWLVTMVMSLLIIAEGYSTLANIVAIRTMKDIKEKDATTIVIKFILKKLREIMFNLMGVDEKKRF